MTTSRFTAAAASCPCSECLGVVGGGPVAQRAREVAGAPTTPQDGVCPGCAAAACAAPGQDHYHCGQCGARTNIDGHLAGLKPLIPGQRDNRVVICDQTARTTHVIRAFGPVATRWHRTEGHFL